MDFHEFHRRTTFLNNITAICARVIVCGILISAFHALVGCTNLPMADDPFDPQMEAQAIGGGVEPQDEVRVADGSKLEQEFDALPAERAPAVVKKAKKKKSAKVKASNGTPI